jgi:archaeosine-15-forming tRNA-guanine transglycosylase
VTQDIVNLRKKESYRNTKHIGRPLQQTRTNGRQISELKNNEKLKKKSEELLVKQLKSCEVNMQELTDSIKRPNLRIMVIEEGEEVQAKGIRNILN